MRYLKPALFVLGLAAVAFFVHHIGTRPIVDTLARLTWWQLVAVCLPFGVISAVDTLGWRYAFAGKAAPFPRLLGARLAGEALNVVTAVGSVGGEAVKAWLIRGDVSYQESVPAVVIGKTTTTIAQALFLLIGAVVAWTMVEVDSRVLAGMLGMLMVEVLAVAGFVAVQVTGLIGRAGRLLVWFGVVDSAASAEELDTALRTYYWREPGRLALSIGFHLAGWLLGVIEAWVMLRCLGIAAGPTDALVIEALGAGVRFATFLIPASLGAFEGANVAAFEALGLGAAAGLAFSFVRRARQLVWIGVGLLVLAGMGWTRTSDPARAAVSRASEDA